MVFPAPAGINRAAPERLKTDGRVPRASGDKPPLGLSLKVRLWCSPRQRG